MSKTTTYHVFQIDAEGTELRELTDKPKSKKATAVDFARDHRKATGEGVVVKTSSGTEVHKQLPKKAIKMSPRYTRVVGLPEGAKLPEGQRVAYIRARKSLAITHDAETGDYAVVNFETGEVLADGLETTRDSGAFCKTVALPAKAEANA